MNEALLAAPRKVTHSECAVYNGIVSQRIIMYTTTWCPDCFRAKRFLEEHDIAFQEINIEETEGSAEFVRAANGGKYRVPTFDVGGHTFHCSPYDPQKLKRELGLTADYSMDDCKA